MATGKIKKPYSTITYTDSTTGIIFYKTNGIAEINLESSSVPRTYSVGEKICDIPDDYLPLKQFSFRETLSNVRLTVARGSGGNGLYATEAVTGNIRGHVVYTALY